MAPDLVVAFYSGGVDNRRRTLAELWSWPDDRLEIVHDDIQWMFPTVQPSGVNPSAPVVTRHTIQARVRGTGRSACHPSTAEFSARRRIMRV